MSGEETAAALLRAEGTALASLRGIVAATVDSVASHKAAVALAGRVGAAVLPAAQSARLMAKRVGNRTLRADLGNALQQPVMIREPAPLSPAEEAQAERDAAEIAAAIVVLTDRRLAKGRVFGEALARDLDGRIRRIAATTASQGFNAEREEASAQFAEDPENKFLPIILRRWNALFDACPVCRALNGQTRPLGISYERGQVPGSAHPFCRCFSTIMPIPIYVTR